MVPIPTHALRIHLATRRLMRKRWLNRPGFCWEMSERTAGGYFRLTREPKNRDEGLWNEAFVLTFVLNTLVMPIHRIPSCVLVPDAWIDVVLHVSCSWKKHSKTLSILLHQIDFFILFHHIPPEKDGIQPGYNWHHQYHPLWNRTRHNSEVLAQRTLALLSGGSKADGEHGCLGTRRRGSPR